MRQSKNKWRIVVGVAVLIQMLSPGYAQQPATAAAKPEARTADSAVHSIVLPQYTPAIAEGPNLQTYRQHCLICHTARCVSMQPRFAKTVWQAEVKKMVDAYGAPISETDQALIVEYLVAVRGAETPAGSSTPPK